MLYAPVINTGDFTYKKVNVAVQSEDPESLLNKMRHLISIRKSNPILALGDYIFLATDQKELLVVLRTHNGENIICVHNLTEKEQSLSLDLSKFNGKGIVELSNYKTRDKITEAPHILNVKPYEFLWLKITEQPE